jgi:hypothetical protein
MKISKSDKRTGGSFSFYVLNATRRELIEKFGEPSIIEEDEDEKSQYLWNLSLEDGTLFYIYDWKEYHYMEMDENIEWHIGADRYANISEIVSSLKDMGFNVKDSH